MIKKILALLIVIAGCTTAPTYDEGARQLPQLEYVECSECLGKGHVIYDSNHPIVKDFKFAAGAHQCPLCTGDGWILKEIKVETQIQRDSN